MKLQRLALFGAALALPAVFAGGSLAQPADGARVIQVPPGAMVLVIGAPQGSSVQAPVVAATAPDAFPMMRLIAQQQAMMQRMMADMDSLFPPMPDPMQMVRAAMEAVHQPGVMTTSIAGGHGVCGESVSYTFSGPGTQPVVHVTRYGDACGERAPSGAQDVAVPQQVAPPAARQPRVLEIGYPPHPVPVGSAPRT
jgi:hypothetical protein